MKPGPWLLICGVPPYEWAYKFRLGKQVAGRSEDCEIRVDHKSVSRRHAKITFTGRELLIEDLRSLNGTQLNGTRVNRANFHVGDTIRIGHVMLDVVAVINPRSNAANGDEDTERSPVDSGDSIECATELLSPTDATVLQLMLEGLPEKTIARRLKLSEHTVHWRVNKRIYKSLGVHSRAQLLSMFLKPGR